MGNQAKVTSLDALDMIRAALVIFLTKARRSVADANDEARTTRMWLQHDRVVHWENEIRKISRKVDQLQQDYMSARLVKNNETALMTRRQALERAKRALGEAQGKLRLVKQWSQNFDSAADPILKRMEGMKSFLDDDMPRAIAYIVALQRTLAAYTQGPPPEDAALPADVPASTTPEAGQPAQTAEAASQPAGNETL
ncbi:MAG TPA: hypothetical protein VG733_19535 [Chthoniobacteraceae bacterium]|nr:hypothetical protein [Chthoniobacteraceae bacterium]